MSTLLAFSLFDTKFWISRDTDSLAMLSDNLVDVVVKISRGEDPNELVFTSESQYLHIGFCYERYIYAAMNDITTNREHIECAPTSTFLWDVGAIVAAIMTHGEN